MNDGTAGQPGRGVPGTGGTYGPPPLYGPLRPSGPGIASCVLAAIALLLAVVLMFVMVAARAGRHGGQPTTEDWMLGFAMLGSMCGGGVLGVAGVVLGIIGVAMPNRSKRLAVVGLVANVCSLLAIVLIMAVSS